MISNTQVQRNALKLHYVCWLGIATRIDRVRLNPKNPIYDIYMYHGSSSKCGMPENVNVDINLTFHTPQIKEGKKF